MAAMILVLVLAGLYFPAKLLAVMYTERGANLYDEGRYEDAMVQFRHALRAYPGFRAARRQLTELEKYMERYPREPDVQFYATPQVLVDRMLELAEVKRSDLVYDLGCGDGRIAVTAVAPRAQAGHRVCDPLQNRHGGDPGHSGHATSARG